VNSVVASTFDFPEREFKRQNLIGIGELSISWKRAIHKFCINVLESYNTWNPSVTQF